MSATPETMPPEAADAENKKVLAGLQNILKQLEIADAIDANEDRIRKENIARLKREGSGL